MLTPSPKLIAYGIAGVAVLCAAVWLVRAVSNTIDRANKYDETQQKLDALSTRYTETVDRFTRAAADDSQVNTALTAFGSRLDEQARAFNQFVSSQPLMREAPNVDKSGTPIPCMQRNPSIYRVLYNGAVDGLVPATVAPVVSQ